MKALIHFFLPALLASIAAPSILGAAFQGRPQALFEYEANDLLSLPFFLLLVIGGLSVFVIPVGGQASLQKSKLLFLLAVCLAGFLGGTLIAMFVLLVASVGGGGFDLQAWLLLGVYVGGTLGGVSAAIWAVFNLPRAIRYA